MKVSATSEPAPRHFALVASLELVVADRAQVLVADWKPLYFVLPTFRLIHRLRLRWRRTVHSTVKNLVDLVVCQRSLPEDIILLWNAKIAHHHVENVHTDLRILARAALSAPDAHNPVILRIKRPQTEFRGSTDVDGKLNLVAEDLVDVLLRGERWVRKIR